jgi:Cu+-exporting ATPase
MNCCSETSARTVKDPVCGMQVDPARAVASIEHSGRTSYFCTRSCRDRFQAEPDRYDGPQQPASEPTSAQTTFPESGKYTCPMHPEVQADKPGSCPKCGMALEPVNLAATTGNTEYTCPMHPQIVRDEPGVCPICGMALEPRDAAADSQNPELINMMRRFWVAAALTLPLIAVMVSDM